MLGSVGASSEFAFDRGFYQHAGVGHQRVDRVDAGVEVVLDFVEIALVGVGDLGRDVAFRDAIHVLGRNVQGPDYGVERLVDALDDLAVVALVLGGVGAGGEFAFDGGFYQHAGVGHQRVDGVDAGVEVVLDFVEIALVGVGDLGRDVALRDAIHVFGRNVQGPDHGVEGLVDTLDDLAVVALMLGGVGAGGQLAFDRGFYQQAGIGHQRGDVVDAGIQVVLDFVEVALVGVGDPGRDIALRDAIHVFGRHVQRPDDRVEGLVHAFDDLAVIALVPGGVGAGGQLAFDRGLHQQVGVRRHVLQRRGDTVDGLLHLLVVALIGLSDQLVDPALRNLGQNAIAFADGQQDGVQHLIDALHDARVGALELVGFAALRQVPFFRGFGQPPQLLLQPLQHHRHVVYGLLHLLVVATVGLGDEFVDLARADLRQDPVAFPDRQQDGIEHRVHALDHLAVVAFEPLYPPALAEAARVRGFHQPDYLFLQQILGFRTRRFPCWTVQNGGAGGRVAVGTNSPAVICSCHSDCSFSFHVRCYAVTGAWLLTGRGCSTADKPAVAISRDSRNLSLQRSPNGAP